LVNAVVPGRDLLDHVQRLAETIAANAPLSVRAAKAMVYASAEVGRTAAFAEAERIWEPVYRSEDAQEGPRSFAEGRPPRWQGR
jgi:enoyl-CoA hydratase/carnithine racemase